MTEDVKVKLGVKEKTGKNAMPDNRNNFVNAEPVFNMGRKVAALFILFIFFFTPSADAEEVEMCLDGEPTVVEISGTFYRKTFPGPPEYESIDKGDRPETQWILKLDNLICVIVPWPEGDDGRISVIRDVKEVTLVFFQQEMYRKYEHLKNERVAVTGTLWEAHTAHHRTPVLITVKEIYPEKEDAP